MTSPPSYRKVNPADAPVLFIALTSPSLSLAELTSYAEHLISPSLSTLEGVAQVNIFGIKRYAVRIRVMPDALSARNLTLDELASSIKTSNANTPVGTLDGDKQTLTLQANKQLQSAAEFANLVVSNKGGQVVRLRDVAVVEDSYEQVKTSANFNGESSITLAIQRQSDANTVKVVDSIKSALPGFQAQLPASVKLNLVNDRSISIRDALHDVNLTLLLTIFLVVIVIFLFLRRMVATIIPTLSLPVSLVGAISLLWGFGYTLDNVSLLGLTLAVGLVVDDAIVMLENIMRHVENGEEPFKAALKGSREVGFTIISISTSLVAVFILSSSCLGVIGQLFHEFAVIVSLAILASAFVSLTLVPMLASRFLKSEHELKAPSRLVAAMLNTFERGFNASLRVYTNGLDLAQPRSCC
jgi:HAE1 family hydrophobic/amphiphilic exporter-1